MVEGSQTSGRSPACNLSTQAGKNFRSLGAAGVERRWGPCLPKKLFHRDQVKPGLLHSIIYWSGPSEIGSQFQKGVRHWQCFSSLVKARATSILNCFTGGPHLGVVPGVRENVIFAHTGYWREDPPDSLRDARSCMTVSHRSGAFVKDLAVQPPTLPILTVTKHRFN